MSVVVFLTEIYMKGYALNSKAMFSDTGALIMKLVMIFIFSLPLIYIAHKKTGLTKELLGLLRIKR